MFASVYGATTLGLVGNIITVETDIANGLPGFEIVGMAATSVKESKERVRSAMKNSGYEFPMRRITMNLAPAELKKDSTGLDVAIAVGIMVSSGQIRAEKTAGCLFIGELSLDGHIRPVKGLLSMILKGASAGFHTVFISEENAAEALLCNKLTVYAVHTLREVIQHLNDIKRLEEAVPPGPAGNKAGLYDRFFGSTGAVPGQEGFGNCCCRRTQRTYDRSARRR